MAKDTTKSKVTSDHNEGKKGGDVADDPNQINKLNVDNPEDLDNLE